jgi:integrase
VEERNERWSLRIRDNLGTGSAGNPRRIRIDLGSSQEIRSEAAARRLADAWLARRNPASVQGGTSIRAGELFEHLLATDVTQFRSSTRRRYRSAFRGHLQPAFGSRPLSAIDTAAVKGFVVKLGQSGLRRSTVQGIRAIVLHALRMARAAGFDAQTIDPRLVRLPKDDVAEVAQRYISQEELQRILDASSWPWKALWAVMGLLGLRVSEALGLAWVHLELDGTNPVIHVRQSAALGALHPLKTRTSRATLPLPVELVGLLQEYRSAWQPNPANLLFASRSGAPLYAENIRRRQWRPLLKQLGIAPAGFHAMRHGRPRALFQAGCSPAVVQKLMRHASLKMTEAYTHQSATDLRDALNAASQRTAALNRSSLQPSPEQPQRDANAL